ncbi:MAG: glycosyltransferase family 9 protein [Bacteroidota bacterium]|nr:glycosyltransferase family 9 protein [Bacteroidota bacterium]
MQKILIIQTAFIGDVILATSVLENIHQSYPHAEIHFLLRKGNEKLLSGHPIVSKVLIWDKKQAKYPELLKLIRKVRTEKYDKVINLQRFASTGIITACAAANNSIGFDKNPFSFLFSKKVNHNIGNGLHEVERNYALISDFVDGAVLPPKLYPSPDDFLYVKKYKQQDYICISPTSVWFTKQFPADRWVAFINKIPKRYKIFLLGGPDDLSACEGIASKAKNENCVVLSGQLSLLQSAALMKNAIMNYVNDSAPLHLCSAMNAPVRAVFCSTVPEFGFGPLSDNSEIVQTKKKLACRPCGLHGLQNCKIENFDCAYSIEIGELLAPV